MQTTVTEPWKHFLFINIIIIITISIILTHIGIRGMQILTMD